MKKVKNMVQNINETQLVNLLAGILKENLDTMWNGQAIRDYVINSRDAESIQKAATQLGCSVAGYKEMDESIIVYLTAEEQRQLPPDTFEMVKNWLSRKVNGCVIKPHREGMYIVTIPKAYNQDFNDSKKFIDAKKNSNKPWIIKDREAVVNPQKQNKR